MNPFSLLFLSTKEVLQIVAKEQDKTRACFAYIPKMDLNPDNAIVSKSKVQFSKVRRSLRINPKLSIQISPPRTI